MSLTFIWLHLPSVDIGGPMVQIRLYSCVIKYIVHTSFLDSSVIVLSNGISDVTRYRKLFDVSWCVHI